MKNKAYYFSHDYNARNDAKLQRLMLEMESCEGVGIYWCLVEMLYENEGKLELKDIKSIAYQLHTTSDKVRKVIADYDLFKNDTTHFWSARTLNTLQTIENIRTKRSEAGKLGNATRWPSQMRPESIANASQMRPESIAKEIKEKESKENKIKESSSSVKAATETLQQRLHAYFLFEKNFADPKLEAERYLEHYESCDWKTDKGRAIADHFSKAKTWGQLTANEGRQFTPYVNVLAWLKQTYDNAVTAGNISGAQAILEQLVEIKHPDADTYILYLKGSIAKTVIDKHYGEGTEGMIPGTTNIYYKQVK